MNEAFQLFKSTREYFTPVLTESAFYDKGMLTPEEFVRAGDQLVRTCPSWKWESGEKAKAKPYLPADKQFLITKGVPSYRRLSVLTGSKLVEESIKSNMGANEGDWCAPELLPPNENDFDDAVLVEAEDVVEDDIVSNLEKVNLNTAISKDKVKEKASKKDDYEDMEDASLALDEASTVNEVKRSGENYVEGSDEDNIVRSRRYDVSITYDNYYRTPRIWLFGFDENGSTLSTNDIFQVRPVETKLVLESNVIVHTGYNARLCEKNCHHRPAPSPLQAPWSAFILNVLLVMCC